MHRSDRFNSFHSALCEWRWFVYPTMGGWDRVDYVSVTRHRPGRWIVRTPWNNSEIIVGGRHEAYAKAGELVKGKHGHWVNIKRLEWPEEKSK